ncbi:hypothetical protein [Desertimonas flava]|uniref:hypothetical protein n=1 Tax=Desertimonas flava TaxID=2064846 RepID=UPI000E3431C3|nr:hypothetical protein [Desertimonas flava]
MDRRAAFFLLAAVVSGLLAPVTDADERWVPIGLAGLYVVLAAASWADRHSRNGRHQADSSTP